MEHSPEETRRAPLLTEAPPSPMHDAEEMEEIECGRVEAVCRCCGACQGGPQHDAAAANKCVNRLLAWIAMNVLVYVGQRLAVAAGLPSDGIDPAGRRATFILASVQMLVLHACGTAIFAHVLAPERRLLTRWTANLGFFVVASVTTPGGPRLMISWPCSRYGIAPGGSGIPGGAVPPPAPPAPPGTLTMNVEPGPAP